jgi:hypothetical protein
MLKTMQTMILQRLMPRPMWHLGLYASDVDASGVTCSDGSYALAALEEVVGVAATSTERLNDLQTWLARGSSALQVGQG